MVRRFTMICSARIRHSCVVRTQRIANLDRAYTSLGALHVPMKRGLGPYRSLLTPDNLAFAKQAGASHLVVHLVDYFAGASPVLDSGPPTLGSGITRNQNSAAFAPRDDSAVAPSPIRVIREIRVPPFFPYYHCCPNAICGFHGPA